MARAALLAALLALAIACAASLSLVACLSANRFWYSLMVLEIPWAQPPNQPPPSARAAPIGARDAPREEPRVEEVDEAEEAEVCRLGETRGPEEASSGNTCRCTCSRLSSSALAWALLSALCPRSPKGTGVEVMKGILIPAGVAAGGLLFAAAGVGGVVGP